MEADALVGGEVRVWVIRTDTSSYTDVPSSYDVLSSEEQLRADKLAEGATRRDYITAHALLRHALTACAPRTAPTGWSFAVADTGKPELAEPPTGAAAQLRFNISHADGVVACVVAAGAECGIDVERIARDQPRRRVLTAGESAMLDAAPPHARPELYARLWTAKEAYGKATGTGVRPPLDRVHVELGDPPTITDDERPADAGSWFVEQWVSEGTHVVSVVVAGAASRLVRRTTWPIA